MILAIPFTYILAGMAILALIGYAVYALSQGKSGELRLEDLEDDDILYDPETGAALSYDEAMQDKAFVDPSATDTTGIYDEEEAVRVTYENLSDQTKDRVSEKVVEAIIKIQGQYVLREPDKIGSDENVAIIVKILQEAGVASLDEPTVKIILEAEKKYSDKLNTKE